ncbi:MAG: CDGSH iron-sulfur domain-containing protein [Bacteroidota bacterium]
MPTRITVLNNANLRVEGEIEIYDQNGNQYDLAGRTRISLCRCGHSSKKPFCDGTHRKVGFQSEVTAYQLDTPKPKV